MFSICETAKEKQNKKKVCGTKWFFKIHRLNGLKKGFLGKIFLNKWKKKKKKKKKKNRRFSMCETAKKQKKTLFYFFPMCGTKWIFFQDKK